MRLTHETSTVMNYDKHSGNGLEPSGVKKRFTPSQRLIFTIDLLTFLKELKLKRENLEVVGHHLQITLVVRILFPENPVSR